MLGQLLFGDELLDKAVDMAAAVELIHCASLFHDDVIDGAQYRKGNRAANAIWGNRSAVIMGDDFFVLAYTLIAGMRDHYLLDLLVKTCRTLAKGVILEIKHTGDISISEDIFMDTITRKTATFFADAARIGGYLAGAGSHEQDLLSRMGLNFGLAFQLSDDLLDLYADPGATGKPKGTDLSSGIFTIAVIHALETDQEFARNYSEMITCNELTKSHIEMWPMPSGATGRFSTREIWCRSMPDGRLWNAWTASGSESSTTHSGDL